AAVAEAGLVRPAAVVAADLARDAAAAEAPARVETRFLSLAAVAAAYPVGRAARAAGLADVRRHTAALAAHVLRRAADAERVHAHRRRRRAAVVAADVAAVGRAADEVPRISAHWLVARAAILAAALVPHVVVEAAEAGARVGAMHVVVHRVAAHRAAALRPRGAAGLAAAEHPVLRAAGAAGVAVTTGARHRTAVAASQAVIVAADGARRAVVSRPLVKPDAQERVIGASGGGRRGAERACPIGTEAPELADVTAVDE